jgi:hypothetical protein
MGYRNVHFRLKGRTIELWGNVPSDADRMMVETTAFTITGALSLDDHIEIQDNLAEP